MRISFIAMGKSIYNRRFTVFPDARSPTRKTPRFNRAADVSNNLSRHNARQHPQYSGLTAVTEVWYA
jgi:hypothetical protein